MPKLSELWDGKTQGVRLAIVKPLGGIEWFQPYFVDSGGVVHGLDQVDDKCSFELDREVELYTEPKPPPKLVTWWAPKVVWQSGNKIPQIYRMTGVYPTKEEFFRSFPGLEIKVLEWKSFEAPEKFEDWSNE